MNQTPQPVSYLRAWLTSQANLTTVLSGGLAAVLASFPAGAAGALGALVVLGAVEAITALIIPDLPVFRSKVDREARRAAIERRRAQLIAELSLQYGAGNGAIYETAMWQKYQAITERSGVLYRIAGEGQSQLSYDDAERVDKASVDFLALWLASVTIDHRLRGGEEATIDRRLYEAERSLDDVDESDPRYKLLKMARDDYFSIKQRHDKLAARRMSIEAAMVSLPDQVEEIYQIVVASPYSNALGSKLGESLSRLQLEEDIELELSQNDLDSRYFQKQLPGLGASSSEAGKSGARGAVDAKPAQAVKQPGKQVVKQAAKQAAQDSQNRS